jgi:hypothetical protein
MKVFKHIACWLCMAVRFRQFRARSLEKELAHMDPGKPLFLEPGIYRIDS